MKLWILQSASQASPSTPTYEEQRFREEAHILGTDIEFVGTNEIDLIVTRGGSRSIRRCGQEVELPDGILPRTGSSTSYFSLAILRQFEHLGVAVINSPRAIEAVKDKLYCQQLLAHGNLPIPRTMLVRFPVDLSLVERQIGFPCVVKLIAGSFGEGVYLSRDKESFRDLMELIASLDQGKALILQEYFGERPGQDLRVWVVGGRVVGAMLRRSVDGSFKANISRGGCGEIYPLDDEIEVLARECAQSLGLEIAGVDLLFEGDGYRVCEVNSAPGFLGFEQATGMNIARTILQHCHWRIRRQLAEPALAMDAAHSAPSVADSSG
ncbi:RimK family alpha-L-glutamate ligase [Vulcanococcus limneticus Candia 3F8]|uniref:ATP-grasp domain-containing protein n=1 Tax=Vulcanococcus limneticus TaxID=2170428 RepID=UPI000B99BEC2|nr:RimK family alpha-L-glutamate ligase [Vulcanococcus limneticus]MCP9792830.1 RimK family alpha-L-glutamate ligase [Vulcanococcus limneticus MW73D5]MCP9894789.1 RimK family alpha-L-glutamate ligase [Vulcanococcus limneticus Candia 3F8]MCP9898289.1 RimK family alpha-L-glutamate ligase [Vulcanococcus limneticus Candia 3B3]